jgi:cell wall-associated NlpC family hydrolase
LPHYTGDQYASTTHISLSELQPGDLVYTGDMGHMAMYIGGGNMVEAPHTGADVRVVPLRSDMVLASRP